MGLNELNISKYSGYGSLALELQFRSISQIMSSAKRENSCGQHCRYIPILSIPKF
jgi:hypothetical protein